MLMCIRPSFCVRQIGDIDTLFEFVCMLRVHIVTKFFWFKISDTESWSWTMFMCFFLLFRLLLLLNRLKSRHYSDRIAAFNFMIFDFCCCCCFGWLRRSIYLFYFIVLYFIFLPYCPVWSCVLSYHKVCTIYRMSVHKYRVYCVECVKECRNSNFSIFWLKWKNWPIFDTIAWFSSEFHSIWIFDESWFKNKMQLLLTYWRCVFA